MDGKCYWSFGLHAHFSPDWLHTCLDLSGFCLDKKNGSLPCKGIPISPGQRMVGSAFPTGRQEVEPELSTSTCTHTLPSQFFFCPRGWTATLSLHSGWPCPGLWFHSWCPLAPAESSSNWPGLHLVRLDYMAKSGPASHHLSRGWCSLAPAESSLKWPRLHLVRIDHMVNSWWYVLALKEVRP